MRTRLPRKKDWVEGTGGETATGVDIWVGACGEVVEGRRERGDNLSKDRTYRTARGAERSGSGSGSAISQHRDLTLRGVPIELKEARWCVRVFVSEKPVGC